MTIQTKLWIQKAVDERVHGAVDVEEKMSDPKQVQIQRVVKQGQWMDWHYTVRNTHIYIIAL